MDWTLAQIRTNGINGIRELTGKKSPSNPTNDQLDAAINDFYLNRFVHEVKPTELKGTFTQSTSPTDSGQYSVSADVAILGEPISINGTDVPGAFLYRDRETFFQKYPSDKTTATAYTLTAPTLSIGVSDTAAVTNAAFTYRIGSNSFAKATAETALSGDTVPQSKYGAWRLEINAAGTISIVEAADNSTGYDTAAQAVAAIEDESTSKVAMGFVTVINTGATFVPGTTALSTGGTVTATYTDGFNSTRGEPEGLLLDSHTLFIRPVPDDIYVIELEQFAKPAELSSASQTVQVPEWGPVIAFGAALEILIGSSDDERIAELTKGYQFYRDILTRKIESQRETKQRTYRTGNLSDSEISWTLSEIRSNGMNGVRELTGKLSLSDPTDLQLNAAINNFYRNRFVHELKPAELKEIVTQATSATDAGEYSVSADVAILVEPIFIDGRQLPGGNFYQDAKTFRIAYPDDRSGKTAFTLSAPNLSIGVSDTAAVTSAALNYRIGSDSYTKATAETALSGDTVPQNKYGAWRLEIEDDRTISIVAADDNATGYATAAQAIADIETESVEAAPLGFVTAVNTGGTFIPGTTALSTGSTVTVTYTDGFHTTRGEPESILLDANTLFVGPKADDIHVLQLWSYKKPTALTSDTQAIQVPEWGPVVAFGTAIELMIGSQDKTHMAQLAEGYQFYKNLIERKVLMQLSSERTKSAW